MRISQNCMLSHNCTLSVGNMLFPVLLEGEAKITNGIVFKRIKKVVKKDNNNDIIKLLL